MTIIVLLFLVWILLNLGAAVINACWGGTK